jgi:ankyrin repeat protein
MSEDKKIGTDVEWFLKAAEQDYCYAQYSLALHYLKMSYIEASEEDEESTQYTDASEDEDTDNNDEKSSEEIVIEHPTEGDASNNNNDDEYVSLEDEAIALMWLRRALIQLYLDENLSEKLEDDEFVSRCIEKSVIGALELCLEMGMDMNSVLRDMDSTPLQMSVSCNSPAIIRLLIEHGVDINVTDVPDLPDTYNNSPNTRRFFEQVIGETQLAIAQACRHNSHEAMLLLLDAGADTQLVEGAMNATRTAFFKMDSTSISILNSRLGP